MQLLLVIQALAVEEEAGGSVSLLPDLPELIWGAVAFLLLFLVLKRFAFPSLNQALEERAANIQGRMEAAERERQHAEQTRRQYEEQLSDARGEANRIIEEARAQSERMRAEIIAKAEEEAAGIAARSREDVEAERGRLVQDLRGQVAALSVELAGKIVGRELDEASHRSLVDQYINELSGLS